MYGLALIALLAVVFGFVGFLPYTGMAYLVSFSLLVLTCYTTNLICATLYDAPTNSESSYITAFILFFLLEPSLTLTGMAWIVAAGFVAMISKYVFAYRNKHLFNPAAFAALALSLAGSGVVIWWVACPELIVPVAILGLLLVRKIRRFDMFAAFLLAAAVTGVAYALYYQYDPVGLLRQYILSWPLVFFGAIMLTEPATTPPTTWLRTIYGVLVGALFSAQFSFGPLSATPQFALIVGNMFAYAVSPKWKLLLTLQTIKDMGSGFYEFIFTADQSFSFRPGQYLEWTIPAEEADLRGNRRYLSISSAPGGTEVRFATRMPKERPSSFKSHMLAMQPGETITAGGLAGDFTLPTDTQQKLVLIAGGIGITPFISQLRDMEARHEQRDIILLYAVNVETDLMFLDVLGKAAGVRLVTVIGTHITDAVIAREVPDYASRLFYISGPNAMVSATRMLLRGMSVSRGRIMTDYFPGL